MHEVGSIYVRLEALCVLHVINRHFDHTQLKRIVCRHTFCVFQYRRLKFDIGHDAVDQIEFKGLYRINKPTLVENFLSFSRMYVPWHREELATIHPPNMQ